MSNLQQLSPIVWIAAIVVIIAASAFFIWLRRGFRVGKVTFKTPVAEAEFERKPKPPEPAGAQPKPAAPESSRPSLSQRTQDMTRSEDGEQSMHGKGGIQKQKMTDSPRGKQKMD